jgi:hypothetical protein
VHLVEVAENSDNSTENRLASAHCIRDLALNKGNSVTPDGIEVSVKKVTYRTTILILCFKILS